MREYKLIPIHDVCSVTANVCNDGNDIDATFKKDKGNDLESNGLDLKDINSKHRVSTQIGGGGNVNNYLDKLLKDKTINDDFKLKLLNIYGQLTDNKQKNNVDSNEIKPDLFDIIIRSSLSVQNNIPDAIKIYHYFLNKHDISWDAMGNLSFNKK